MSERDVVNPYAPNAAAGIKKQMMKEIGIDDIMELFDECRVPCECAVGC